REDGRETGVQLIGVLVEAVFQRLALGDEVVDRAQGDEGESRRRAVGEPGGLDAGTKALNEAQALTPRRQLLARALEAHVRRPALAQQPVPEQARSAAEPGPGRQQSELLLRRVLKVALARDPERIVAPRRLKRLGHTGEPMRRQPLIARKQAQDAQREF